MTKPFFARDFLAQKPEVNRAFIDFCCRMGWCSRPKERNWLESVIRPGFSPATPPRRTEHQPQTDQPGENHGVQTQPAEPHQPGQDQRG